MPLVPLPCIAQQIRLKVGTTTNNKNRRLKSFVSILLLLVISSLCYYLNSLAVGADTHRITEVPASSHLSSSQQQLLPLLLLPTGSEQHDVDNTVIPPNQRKHPSQIKYAAFGTSITWGSKLGEGTLEERKTFAYPWLLSPNATNFAIRAGGPAYAATCASTMVGNDDVFDVVVFEHYLRADEGLLTLAQRIRERFPDALLIFLLNWNPTMIGTLSSNRGILQWANTEHGLDIKKRDLNDPKIHRLFVGEENEEEWAWHLFTDPLQRALVLDAAREVGGYVSPMLAPDNPRDWIQYADSFASDAHHLSIKGHMDVAQRIRDIVEWHGVPQNSRLENFIDSDYCVSWFETGETDGIEYSPNGMVECITGRKVLNRNKYSLHFVGGDSSSSGSGSGRGEGWIRVNNPADGPLALYLGYMTTGPPPSVYPRTEVTIEGIGDSGGGEKGIGGKQPVVVLDVNSADVYGDRDVHISRVEKVGIINPGYSLVRFREVEEAEVPFRLVSVLVASEGAGARLTRLPGGIDKWSVDKRTSPEGI